MLLARISVLAATLLLAACGEPDPPPHLRVAGGDATRGRDAIERYGCLACHVIPGFRNTVTGHVGPPLDDYAARSFVAGVMPNWPQFLVPWIVNPPAHSPQTAMPNLGVSVDEARDIAAYLYSFGTRHAAVYPPRPVPLPAAPATRLAVEAAEDEILSSYGWVDAERGLVRIPIERAMELLADAPQ